MFGFICIVVSKFIVFLIVTTLAASVPSNILSTLLISSTKSKLHSDIRGSIYLTRSRLQSSDGVQITEDDILVYINQRKRNAIVPYTSSNSSLVSSSSSTASQNIISKWNSTIIELKKLSKNELKFFSRSSFNGSIDLFENILKVGYDKNKYKNPFEEGLIVSIFLGSFISLIILPALPTNNVNLKNIIGLLGLSMPFIYMFITTAFPDSAMKILLASRPSLLFKSSEDRAIHKESRKKRLCIHEAGHFLVGYLCGYPVLSYEINGDHGAQLVIGTASASTDSSSANTVSSTSSNSIYTTDVSSVINKNKMSDVQLERLLGSLLTISMAGLVAEALSFGDAQGGVEDWPTAYRIASQYRQFTTPVPVAAASAAVRNQQQGGLVSSSSMNPYQQQQQQQQQEEIDQYLRGAVAKCLVLLRIHRKSLLRVARAMEERKSIVDCIEAIESEPA